MIPFVLAIVVAALTMSQQSSALGAFLPAAPPGWTSSDGEWIDQAAGGIEASRVERSYTRADGTTVTIAIVRSPQAVAVARSAGMAFSNPQMIEMMNENSAGAKTYAQVVRDGWTGWSVVEHGVESEARAFKEQLLLQIDIDRADADALQLFMDAIDWAGLGSLTTL